MRVSIYMCIIMITSLFAKEEKFEGYVNTALMRGPSPIYAIGNYEDDLMTGLWEFYTDSTKNRKIAKGSFINGNGSKISDTGIPYNGRHGEWKHYYSRVNSRYNNYNPTQTFNQLKSYQNWNNGVKDGQFITYYRDGKKSASSYYKDGKRDGIRKEWFSGGFQGTRLHRNTKFINGKLLHDKLYTFGNRKLVTSTYKKEGRIDSIFQSSKGYNSNIFIVKTKNRMKMFHDNGEIFNDYFINKDNSGSMRSYYDNGQLMIEEKFDSSGNRYWKNNSRICYNPEGEIIDNMKFKDGNIHGEVVELMTSKTIINSNFHKLFSPYVQRDWRKKNSYYNKRGFSRGQFSYKNYEIDKDLLLTDDSQHFTKYNWYALQQQIESSFIPIGPYPTGISSSYAYKIQFHGLKIKTLNSKELMLYNYCVGYGNYNSGVRIGKWYWEDQDGNKILAGQFNNEGKPIEKWDNYGVDEVLSFSDDGILMGTLKTRIR